MQGNACNPCRIVHERYHESLDLLSKHPVYFIILEGVMEKVGRMNLWTGKRSASQTWNYPGSRKPSPPSQLTYPYGKPSSRSPSTPSPAPYPPTASAPDPDPPPLAAWVSGICATTSSLSPVHCSNIYHQFRHNPSSQDDMAVKLLLGFTAWNVWRYIDGIARRTFVLECLGPSCRGRRCRWRRRRRGSRMGGSRARGCCAVVLGGFG